jgi:hypothetical protein
VYNRPYKGFDSYRHSLFGDTITVERRIGRAGSSSSYALKDASGRWADGWGPVVTAGGGGLFLGGAACFCLSDVCGSATTCGVLWLHPSMGPILRRCPILLFLVFLFFPDTHIRMCTAVTEAVPPLPPPLPLMFRRLCCCRIQGRKREDLDAMLQTLGLNAANPVRRLYRQLYCSCTSPFLRLSGGCMQAHAGTVDARRLLSGLELHLELRTICLQLVECEVPEYQSEATRCLPARPSQALVGFHPRLPLLYTQVCVMTQDTARNFLAGSSSKVSPGLGRQRSICCCYFQNTHRAQLCRRDGCWCWLPTPCHPLFLLVHFHRSIFTVRHIHVLPVQLYRRPTRRSTSCTWRPPAWSRSRTTWKCPRTKCAR